MEIPSIQFYHTLRVRYAEIDAQGIVFNAHYLTYFDTTLNELFREVGLTPSMPDPIGLYKEHDFNLVKSLVEYRQPVYFDQLIDIYAGIRRIGRSSLTFNLYLTEHGKRSLRTFGEVVWVYANQNTYQSVELPADVKDLLEPYLI